jgi:hypothetical protein
MPALNSASTFPPARRRTSSSRLDAEVLQMLKDEALRKRFNELGMEVTPVSRARSPSASAAKRRATRRSSSRPA